MIKVPYANFGHQNMGKNIRANCHTPNRTINENAQVVGIGFEFVTTLKFSYHKILFSTPFILSTKLKTQWWLT